VDVKRAAQALGAQVLVTGRVDEMDGWLRITVELVNGSDGIEIWFPACRKGQFLTYFEGCHFELCIPRGNGHVRWRVLVQQAALTLPRPRITNRLFPKSSQENKFSGRAAGPPHRFRYYLMTSPAQTQPPSNPVGKPNSIRTSLFSSVTRYVSFLGFQSRHGCKGKAPSKQTLTAVAASKKQEGKCSRNLELWGLLYQHSPCWHRVSPKQECIIPITLRGIIIDTATGIPTGVTGIRIVAATMTNGGGGIASKPEETFRSRTLFQL